MYKKLFFSVSLVLVLALASNAAEVEKGWTNADGNDILWSNGNNWSPNTPPGPNDLVFMGNVGDFYTPGNAGDCILDYNAPTIIHLFGPGGGAIEGVQTLYIDGGNLTSSDYVSIGHGDGSLECGQGIVDMNNGASLYAGLDLHVGGHGDGVLNIGGNSTVYTPGPLRLAYGVSIRARVNVGLGTLNVDNLVAVAGKDFNIDITEGTFIVRNKTGAAIQVWIDKKYITAYGGTGTVIHTISLEGWDVLTARTGTSIVDDFESYEDSADLRNTWVENKAGVVYLEETIAHDGNSMKIVYDGTSPYYYEAVRTYATAQDWSVYDTKVLDVWFRGKLTNDAEQMYVTVSDGTNSATVVNNDPNTQSETWQVWRIELQDFTDVNLAGVEQISIGIGNGSSPAGSGEVYFDDVALFPSRCFDKPTLYEGNFNGD
jgi:hypothetical protein